MSSFNNITYNRSIVELYWKVHCEFSECLDPSVQNESYESLHLQHSKGHA